MYEASKGVNAYLHQYLHQPKFRDLEYRCLSFEKLRAFPYEVSSQP